MPVAGGDAGLREAVDQLTDALLSHLSYEERELAEPARPGPPVRIERLERRPPLLSTIAVQNYRSLHELRVPLGQLTVVTGANGSGKSNLYRALRLLADCAERQVIASLAREGRPARRRSGPDRR